MAKIGFFFGVSKNSINFAHMFVSTLLLSALISMPTAPDTLRQEQLDEVVVKSNSARQRLRQIQTGAEQVRLQDLTASIYSER